MEDNSQGRADDILSTAVTAGPVGEDSVAAAEEVLGVKFPEEYVEFLRGYGAAMLDGFEIAGLVPANTGDGPPLWVDVVEETLRKIPHCGVGKEYVFLSDDGFGYTYFLRCDSDVRLENCEIFEFGPGIDLKQVASGLIEFLNLRAKD